MATNLQILSNNLASQYPTTGVTFYLALIADNTASYTFTANTSTEVITTSTNHNYINTLPITFTGSNLPAPLVAGTTYYVINATSNTFQVAATSGGVAINLTSAGSGVMTVSDLPMDETYTSLSFWLRKEITNYQGVNTRQAFIPVAPTIDYVNKNANINVTTYFNNTNGGLGITFNKVLLIRGGNSTPGNTSGTFDSFWAFSGSQTIAAGENRGINIPIQFQNG